MTDRHKPSWIRATKPRDAELVSDRHKLMSNVAAEFLAAARAFRAALVAEDVLEREFARQVRNALARVYLAAALLGPPTTVETNGEIDLERDVAPTLALSKRLADRLGEANHHTDVFDPTGITSDDLEPMPRSLSMDLSEIDADLAAAIGWLEQEAPDVQWQVRFDFEQHWGKHAIDALRPLHHLAVYGVV